MKRSCQYLRSWRKTNRELKSLTDSYTQRPSCHKVAHKDTEYEFQVLDVNKDEAQRPHGVETDGANVLEVDKRKSDSTINVQEEDIISGHMDIYKLLLTKIITMEEKITAMEKSLRQLLQILASQQSESQMQDSLRLEPCTNLEEFNVLETNLQDKAFFQKAVHFLSLIGGRTVGENTRRTMLAVANNAVWSGYSLYGRKQKAKLCELKMYNLIKRAVKTSLPECTDKDIEVQIMEVLKHASQKLRREVEAQQRTNQRVVRFSDSD